MNPRGPCLFVDLGVVGVPDLEKLMIGAAELRSQGRITNLLLLAAHPRTVALGLRDRTRSQPKDLLVSASRLQEEGIALTRSVRGGGVTYHWPGQVVCYPVMLLGPRERDIPGFMHKLEEVGIRTLEGFGLHVTRKRDSSAHVGLWMGNRKLVSMGIRIAKWVTSFGFVINVDGNHRESAYVRPCGLEGVVLATMEEMLGHAPPRSHVIETVKESFALVFQQAMEPMPADVLELIRSELTSGVAQPTEAGVSHG
jgi:lipoate-protein ligase B